MRRFLRVLASLAISLWLGGLIVLYIAVASLFQTLDHHTAGTGATGIFHAFEPYQLVLAAVAIVASWLGLPRGRGRAIVLAMLILAAFAAVAITFGISPRINALRDAGETDTDAFKQLHGMAMGTYLLLTILVAIAAVTFSACASAGKSPTAPADQTSPAEPADRATAPR